MKKLGLFLFGVILLAGAVLAANTLSNLEGINFPLGDVVAGSSAEATFDFNYFNAFGNEDGSPLIIKLRVLSNNESYPVGKGEFEISGTVQKYFVFGMIPLSSVNFVCNESSVQVISHPRDSVTVTADDGVFYCYNADGDLSLNEHDDITLEITPNYAIYPGTYNLSAELFYLEDDNAPMINITNKVDFDRYYRELNNIEVEATIDDISPLDAYWGTVFASSNITVPFSYETGGIYHFSRNLPNDIAEGEYALKIFAEDNHGNIGEDLVTLKIDRTGPVISAIEPSGLYADIIPIELTVSDEKAGVNTSDVYYRLREMNGSNICPADGSGTWDCYNSGWVKLEFNESFENYQASVNVTEVGLDSGEYWFEAKAYDLLKNEGVLE